MRIILPYLLFPLVMLAGITIGEFLFPLLFSY